MVCIDTWPCTIWFWSALLIEIAQACWPVLILLAFFLMNRRVALIATCVLLLVFGAAASALETRCSKVVRGFHDAWGNEEDYVQSFPLSQQRAVRGCLDRHWKVMQK